MGGTSIGGICGVVGGPHSSDQISYCSYTGSISGDSYAGGIYGVSNDIYDRKWNVISCRSDANINISGDGYAGGIYGYTVCVSVIACYSTGSIVCEDNNANYVGGIGGYTKSSSNCDLCYSTITSSCANFSGLSGSLHYRYLNASDCASVAQDMNATLTNCDTSCRDIATFLKECYSQYASYYNFNNTWTWSGNVAGESKSVNCPKLSWE